MKIHFFLLYIIFNLSVFAHQKDKKEHQTPIQSTLFHFKNIVIKNPFFIKRKGAVNGSVYMTITQTSEEDDVLLSATCNQAASVELHDHVFDPKTEIKKMVKLNELTIPGTHAKCSFFTCWFQAKQNPVELKKGGRHIMLMQMKEDAIDQKDITLVLNFKKAGSVELKIPRASHDGPCNCPHHHH